MKQLVKKFVRLFGAELVSSDTLQHWQRQSQEAVLKQIVTLDQEINTVIDVGAAHGEWSLACARIFPNARYELFEPLVEYGGRLDGAVSKLGRAAHHNVALHRESGEMQINVHPDLVGSSFYLENEDSDVNGYPRSVKIATLDSVRDDGAFEPPFLLKIDVQGAEHDVLAGAERTLQECAFVVCETSFFNFYEHGGSVGQIIQLMEQAGFAIYDIFGLSYRPLDGALAQADLCFVKTGSKLRARHEFATAAQRREVTARLHRLSATTIR